MIEVNAPAVLQSIGIDLTGSVHTAVQQVDRLMGQSENKMAAANELLGRLGIASVGSENFAIMAAKGIVEQAFIHGYDYDAQLAADAFREKYVKILKHIQPLSVLDSSGDSGDTDASTVKLARRAQKGAGNDKKAAVRELYDQHAASMAKADLIRLIAAELSLTTANVTYYIRQLSS